MTSTESSKQTRGRKSMTHTASSEVPVAITDEPRFGNMDTLAPNLLQSVALSGGGTLVIFVG
jgi:hypothetical protein